MSEAFRPPHSGDYAPLTGTRRIHAQPEGMLVTSGLEDVKGLELGLRSLDVSGLGLRLQVQRQFEKEKELTCGLQGQRFTVEVCTRPETVQTSNFGALLRGPRHTLPDEDGIPSSAWGTPARRDLTIWT